MKLNQSILRMGLAVLLATEASLSSGQVDELFNLHPENWTYGRKSQNFGYMDVEQFPWVNMVCLGWVYTDVSSTPEAEYLWNELTGWIYTTSDSFPIAYLYNRQEWVLFDLTNSAEVKFYSFQYKVWPTLKMISGYDEVPVHLQGINAAWWTYRPYFVKIGRYLMFWTNWGFMGTSVQTYAYDADQDEFYPTTEKNVSQRYLEEPNNYRYKVTIEGNELVLWQINGWTGAVTRESGEYIIEE